MSCYSKSYAGYYFATLTDSPLNRNDAFYLPKYKILAVSIFRKYSSISYYTLRFKSNVQR